MKLGYQAVRGVAGWVYCTRSPLNVPNAYADSRFFPGIDQLTGFRTKNILCVPLVNRNKECIGTIQALNKASGDFNDDDRQLLGYLSNFITVAIENAKLYEKIRAADEAKQRAIDHLSHELKTPLSIISAAFSIIEQKTRQFGHKCIERAASRGRRSVARLMDLQEKVEDIINKRSVDDTISILSIIEDTFNILEELDDANRQQYRKIFGLVKKRLESLFVPEKQQIELLQFDQILDEILCKKPPNKRQYPEIITKIQKGLFIRIDRNVLKKVLEGLLKNAVENTPDEGRIEITVDKIEEGVRVEFRDYGIGITDANQKNIFSGFFHTRDTNFYTSKKPYDFYAGGAGLDLLRTKVFSEIFGFSVQFESERCKFIPRDTDLCEGKISACPFVKKRADCLSSGGSTFAIEFKTQSG